MRIPTLRRHQSRGIEFFSRCIKEPGFYLRQAPTGSGKSLELRAFLYYLISLGYRVIITTVSHPVCKRFKDDIQYESFGKVLVSSDIKLLWEKIPHTIILTHQAMWRRIEQIYAALGKKQFEIAFDKVVLFIDEAHHSGLEAPRNRNAISKMQRVIATTATPWPDGVTEESSEYIGDGLFKEVLRYTISDALLDNPPVVCPIVLHPFLPEYDRDIGRAIWFYRDKESIASDIQNHKRKLAVLHSDVIENEQEKQRILDAFARGQIDEILTCKMVAEGIDVPLTTSIVYKDTFKSFVFLVQSFGRALRVIGTKKAHGFGDIETIQRLEQGINK